MNNYPVFVWTVTSAWRSGAITFDKVYVSLPDLFLAKNYIFNHMQRFFPRSDVRLRTSVNLLRVIKNEETLPAAYRLQMDEVWGSPNVVDMYPEILAYWTSKGFKDIRVTPCGPVDEDCLYLDGKWYSYCRYPYEWMQREDLCDELKPPVAKKHRRNCTI